MTCDGGAQQVSCLKAPEGEVRVGVEAKDLRTLLRRQVLDGLAVDIDVRARRHRVAHLRLGIAVQLVVRGQDALNVHSWRFVEAGHIRRWHKPCAVRIMGCQGTWHVCKRLTFTAQHVVNTSKIPKARCATM